MANLRMIFSRQIMSVTLVVALVGLPLTSTLSVSADDLATCTPPPASAAFHYPTGSDAATFTYDCATGLWENAHFTLDPATGERTALDPIVYTCDSATSTYNVTLWAYSPSAGAFQSYTQNVAQPPVGATVVACPPPATQSPMSSNAPDSTSSLSPASSGSNTTDTSLNNNANLNNANNLTVNNNLGSTATSGNAIALGNTTVGDTTTGNADIVASEMNLLQTAANFGTSGGQPITFVANINGDVNGDFLLDPSTITSIQPATTNTNNNNLNNNLTINNTTNSTLNNTLNLNAASGNATANDNTTTGNVKTGNADVVANVVNTIDSAITAGHSFLGVININGNLNGDILLPPDFVNQLLAANVPTVNIVGPGNGSSNTNNTTVNNTTTVTNTNNQGINNNVTATAASGAATASDNTTVGGITTGNATTNITAFNLTGSTVIGSNDLLVFVNVLGKWVGLIVNAPPGTTAAELGGGITTSGSGSTNANNTTVNNNSNVTNNTSQQINNNINVNAKSGDATANRNTSVGNVSSGNAEDAVNLLNVQNSTLTLSNWFGILFINVFGSWNGSFGINTAAGDPITNSANGAAGATPAAFAAFSFVPNSGSSGGSSHAFQVSPFIGRGGGSTTTGAGSNTSIPGSTILAAATTKNNRPSSTTAATAPEHVNWLLIIASSSLFATYLVAERLYAIRQSRLN
ncbi:MAG TPA: hypothetical protein VH234_03630 [Candidatus Saccharimonadales bacterium]|nr:hypothetical protein [Candidatus Saccharimonadales bacterium]